MAADCENLPNELSEMVAMGDDNFACFRERLEECVNEKDKQKFNQIIAEALWGDRDSQQKRLPVVVQEILKAAVDVADREGGIKDEGNLRIGVALVKSLFKFGTSPSLDFVQFRRAKKNTSGNMALVFGFAGGEPEEIEPQIKHYLAAGLHVVSTTHIPFPRQLRQRQFCRVASYIKSCLSPGSKIIVHACSGHGQAYFGNVMALWFANEAPFNDLPPLETCLAGAAFECVATYTESVQDTHHEAPPAIDPERELNEGGDTVFYMAAYSVVEDLIKKNCPDTTWTSVASKHRNLLMFLRGSRPLVENFYHRVDDFGANLRFWDSISEWRTVEAFERPIPRLFLYSTEDKLYTADNVENGIDKLWSAAPKARFLTAKCTKSPHMKLWDGADRAMCQKTVTNFIKMARVTSA